MLRTIVMTLLFGFTFILSTYAALPKVSFVLQSVQQVNSNGQLITLKAGDELTPNAVIRLGQDAVCEIAVDTGNAYLRLDQPGDFALNLIYEKEGQNHSSLDIQTRLDLKWQRISGSLPSHSKTITLPGIRGGVVRSPLAKLRPGLEHSTFAEPFFLTNAKGSAAAIWHSKFYQDQEISFAKMIPGKLPKVTRLTQSEGASCWPWLAGDPDGLLFAAWEDDRDKSKKEIYFKKSLDGGTTWSEAQRMTTHGMGAYDPVIWTQGETIILIWEDARKGIYSKTSLDNGNTWSEETRLVKGDSQWPQISGTSENLWLVWVETTQKSKQIKAVHSNDQGITWGKPVLVKKSTHDIGEPSLSAFKNQGVAVVWRDNRGKQSRLYSRTSLNGHSWTEDTQITQEDRYHEYPSLFQTDQGIALLHYSPTFQWNYAWLNESNDQGMTWSESLRLPGITNNVEKSFFIADFSIPWDKSIYTNVDMTLKVNRKTIGKLEDVLPEGQCLFEFDPRILEYAAQGQAKNQVEFNTKKMNGGDYHINNGFKIVQSMSQQEMMVVANSQSEADTLAGSLLPDQVNHAVADVGVFANKIDGLPEERQQVGPVTLDVEVFNLGARSAENIEVYIAKGEQGEGKLLSQKVILKNLLPGNSHKVQLIFQNDGTFYHAAVVAKMASKDSDPSNNRWMFRMGYAKQGQLKVIAEAGTEIIIQHQSTSKEVARIQAGESVTLPIAVYRITAAGEPVRVRENIAVKGGETIVVSFQNKGTLRIEAPEPFLIKIFQADQLIQKATCNQAIEIEAGFYQVVVENDDGDVTKFQDVLIQSRKQTNLSVKMGYIGVSSLGNYPAKLYYPNGEFFREISGAQYVHVPAGMYHVKMKPEDYPERDLGIVDVKENKHVKMQLTGFGQVGVVSAGQWDYTLYNMKGEKFKEISGEKMFTTIVPVGSYQVKVKPVDYDVIDLGRIVVKENDVVKLKTPGFGKFGVESPGNWDCSLFYLDGRKFKDIKGSEMQLTVVPSGQYIAKVYPEEFDPIDLGEITIEDNAHVKKKVQGFGWIGVVSLGKWDAQLYYSDGREFKTIRGDQYKYTIIPEGTYHVKVKPDPYPEQDMGNFQVKSYEKIKIEVKGFGQIGIESIGNWGSELFTLAGKKLCDLSPKDIYLKVVPTGKYIVKLKPEPYTVRNLGEVEVMENKPTRIKVTGYGLVALSPTGNYTAELYREGKMVREVQANSAQYTIVPIGEYNVKVSGRIVSQVSVKEKEKLKIETGYLQEEK